MLHGKKSAIYKSKSGSNGILFQKLFWPTVKKNCSSDWDFFGYHKNNFWNRVLFWLVTGGFCRSLFIRTIKMQVGTNKCDVKTCRKKSKKVVWFAKRGAKKINKISHREICRRLSAPQHSAGVSECQKSWRGGGIICLPLIGIGLMYLLRIVEDQFLPHDPIHSGTPTQRRVWKIAHWLTVWFPCCWCLSHYDLIMSNIV